MYGVRKKEGIKKKVEFFFDVDFFKYLIGWIFLCLFKGWLLDNFGKIMLFYYYMIGFFMMFCCCRFLGFK